MGTTTTSTGTVLVRTLNDTGWTDGVRGAAIALGPAGFVDLPVSSALQLTGDVSISIWYFLERALSPGECVNLVIHGSAGGSGAIDNDIYAFNLVEPGFVLYSERQTQIPNGVGSPPIPEAPRMSGITRSRSETPPASGSTSMAAPRSPASPRRAPSMAAPRGISGSAPMSSSRRAALPGALDELYIYPRSLDDAEARTLFDER